MKPHLQYFKEASKYIAMMSHVYADDECNECIEYVKPITNSQSWRCSLCLIAESALCFDGETQLWSRYQLPCGHEVHERCYRTWAKHANKVGCPRGFLEKSPQKGASLSTCTTLEKVEKNRYCPTCDTWGHSTIPDCIVKQSRKELMRHAAEAKEERAKYEPFSLKK